MHILGLSGIPPWDHDASACLIDGDTIIALAEEERFVRKRRASGLLPYNATIFCLSFAGMNVNELDVIACGKTGRQTDARDVLPEQFLPYLKRHLPVVRISHHEAHAASCFYSSPFRQAAVLVIDGQGDDESISIWAADEKGLEKLASFGVHRSLGYMYGAIATYCGFGYFSGGKVMGLAPYGTPKYIDMLSSIYRDIRLDSSTRLHADIPYVQQFHKKMQDRGLEPRTTTALEQVHCDLAASAQALLEREVLGYVRQAKRLTGSSFLCMAGGVAMNCVTNSIVQNSGIFDDIFLQPGCEDCGISLGSALAVTKQKVSPLNAYLGPCYTDEEIASLLKSSSITFTRLTYAPQEAAKLVAANLVIGWFQGRLEYGPRALGNRSILAHPASTVTRDRVNGLKHREGWRPFGPSVLAERASDLFERSHESPFMLRSFTVKDSWRKRLTGVTHIDGSTRPQTVSKHDNPLFYELIRQFNDLTGIPAVLNTSFNDHDEPIVATPRDALKTFRTTRLDALVLGNFLIMKSDNAKLSF